MLFRSSSSQNSGSRFDGRHRPASNNGHPSALAVTATTNTKAHTHNSENKKENVSYRSPLRSDELGEEKQQCEKPVITASDSLRTPKKRKKSTEDEIEGQQRLAGGVREHELESHYSDRLSELQRENQALKGKNSDLEQENRNLRNQTLKNEQFIHQTQSSMTALQQKNLKLEKHLKLKDEKIAEFTRDIAQLSNEEPDSRRDDHYFESALSVLFKSIQDWVLRYYGNMVVPADSLDVSIPSRMLDRLGDGCLAHMRDYALELLQIYIISELRTSIFTPFLFGVVEGSQNLYSTIESSTGKFVVGFQECD